eukprot:276850-Pelagomonas_calceolata.AAC.2
MSMLFECVAYFYSKALFLPHTQPPHHTHSWLHDLTYLCSSPSMLYAMHEKGELQASSSKPIACSHPTHGPSPFSYFQSQALLSA